MEKLVECKCRSDNGNCLAVGGFCTSVPDNYCYMAIKLKEYTDLEEQGKLLKLPCAVGDTVYEINTMRNKVSKFQIIGITISKYGFFINWNLVDGIYRNLNGFNDDEIGKTVFLNQEAAEAALKKQ